MNKLVERNDVKTDVNISTGSYTLTNSLVLLYNPIVRNDVVFDRTFANMNGYDYHRDVLQYEKRVYELNGGNLQVNANFLGNIAQFDNVIV